MPLLGTVTSPFMGIGRLSKNAKDYARLLGADKDKKIKDIPSALEDLAQSMRQSEMALREHSSKLRKAEHAKIFAKYQDFFTGGRMTITPELEHSRQKVWTMIRQQSKEPKKTTITAAA